MKALFTICFVLLLAACSAGSFRSNDILEDYERYLEKKAEEKVFDSLMKRADKLEPAVDKDGNGNRDTCDAVGVKCHHCTQCWPGGWCVTGKTGQPRCLCKHGWIGPNAHYVTDSDPSIPPEGRNRAYANSCATPCHYTHDFRGNLKDCLGPVITTTPTVITTPTVTTPPPINDPECHVNCTWEYNGDGCLDRSYKYTGQFLKCKCCRGWSGKNAFYDKDLNRYVADYCDKECPYLGKGIPNPGCNTPKPCHKKCGENGGKCDVMTGKCECCYGWTGPNPAYQSNNRIHADYCDVYCPYTKDKTNQKCVDPNHINNLRKNPNKVFTP